MIKVAYDRKALELTVSGHACAASYGFDVVCAGVSTLVFTLMHELIRRNIPHERSLKPGYAKVKGEGGRECFDCVATGLMLLAENYPGAVEFGEG